MNDKNELSASTKQIRLNFNKRFLGGLCERCQQQEPDTVIHRKFDILSVGIESMFDLEAICSNCHNKLIEAGRELYKSEITANTAIGSD